MSHKVKHRSGSRECSPWHPLLFWRERWLDLGLVVSHVFFNRGVVCLRHRQTQFLHYDSWMGSDATLLMWFQLRSPERAEEFEQLMAGDRDIVRGSLDSVSDWRLTRPSDVPGQALGQADYVLIAEIVGVERFEQQGSERVQGLEDDLAHLVSSRGMLVVRPIP